jgi:hypothetical protein
MTSLRHLRSSTANKRPDPTAMVDGQLAMNYDIASPGLFFKDDNGTLIKVGPVHVGTTAPNVSPAAGGTAGNSIGEQWLDTTSGVYVLKVWDGSAWRSESGTFVDVSGDTMTGALTMANQQAVRFSETTANGSNYIALQADAALASNKTITLPDTTGTVVTTGDTGTVTSTMIANDTIINADVNASAAIVDTKLATIATAGKVSNSATTATDANTASAIVARDGSGNFTAGTITAALTGAASSNVLKAGDTMTGALVVPLASAATPSLTFTGDTNTGIYSSGADQLAISTGGTVRLFVDANGYLFFKKTTTGIGSDGLEIQDTGGGARVFITQPGNGVEALSINMRHGAGTQYAQYFYYGGTLVGNINVTSTATAYVTSSDYRLKKNVQDLSNAIGRLQQLKPSRFNFLVEPSKTFDGFLAHEVQSVVPEAISGEKDAVDDEGNPIYQGIDQSKLVPLLTAALQEAIAKIETLEGMVAVNNITIDEQQHQLSTLAARLTALESA